MDSARLADWTHDHTFGQDRVAPGERRTLWIALATALFMVVEISAGLAYGSIALLADGLHMGSHAVALGIAVAAYVYARLRAGDERFSFGTGKVNALGGYTGALLLAVFAVLMAWESVDRFLHPVAIVFDQAIAVAVLGLFVNGVSVAVLGVHHGHAHEGHGHEGHGQEGHGHEGHGHEGHGHEGHGQEGHGHEGHGHEGHGHEGHGHEGHGHEGHGHEGHGHARADHNLRAAYFHVLADALTSLLAIFALLGGRLFGLAWLDPAMGIVGALLVARWALGLIRQSSRVLLDHQEPANVRDRARSALEVGGDRVVDLHVWSIGPGVRAACISIVSPEPTSPLEYKARLPSELRIEHATVEVHRAPDAARAR